MHPLVMYLSINTSTDLPKKKKRTTEMWPVNTSINQSQWPTPLPRGLNLEHSVRSELLNKGAEYVWLDVLCLRQHATVNDTKVDEWKLDVPTIGNIYRAAVGIARYFNGLGQVFRTNGWDDPRHWLCRAWTLQEIRSEKTTYNAGILTLPKTNGRAHIIMNTSSLVDGKATTLRQALHPIVKLAAQVDSPSGCSVYELVQQMAKRCATQPTDKVAGLFYLLRTTQLPTYDASICAEDAWARCFHVLPFERKIEILFDFPYGGSAGPGCQWFPTWIQLMEWPVRDFTYEHTVAVWDQAHLQFSQAQESKSLFVPEIWAISDVQLSRTHEPNEYQIDIDIGNETFAFYYPYVHQKPIEMSTSDKYILVTTDPDHSYNWVVCKSLGVKDEECALPGGVVKMAGVQSLSKLGVLRTDSSSEFFLGRGRLDSILKKINALFI